ncbi:hypothetical protein BH10ACT1_BH10ACT1_21010 [soil metagenome]
MSKLNEIHAIAMQQHGIVSRSNLSQIGVTRDARRSAIRSGSLVPLGRQTFRAGGSPETDRQRVLAACVEVGGIACRGTAAWLHDIDGFEAGVLPSVVVAKPRSDYRVGMAEVHASTWLPAADVLLIDGIPCLSVARTLFSLASAVPSIDLERVCDAIDVTVRDGKATDKWLWWLLERIRCRGRNGVTVFEGLLVERSGARATESWLEREFLKVLAGAGIAAPRCQRRVKRSGAFVARVDFSYDGLGIVIEVTGHAHHSTRRQRDADARRRNELSMAGLIVIEFTYDDLVSDPAYVVAKVIELLAGVP